MKYSYGDNAPQGVYAFAGLSFQPSFKEVLGMHPDALEEANKSLSRNAIMLIGSFTMLAGSAMMLSDTLNDVKDLSNDEFPDDSNSTTPLIVIVAGGVLYIAGALSSGDHLTNARAHV